MSNGVQRPALTSELPEFPARPPTAHKGAVGFVAVVAGSRGMSGAACLAGLGALRGGAGLVRVLTAASVQPIVAMSDPCLMTVPLPETAAGHIARDAWPVVRDGALSWAHVVAFGPGLGRSDDGAALGAALVRECGRLLVVDADGLNNLAPAGAGVWLTRPADATILTPHPGELNRLLRGAGLPELSGDDDESRLAAAHAYAAASRCVVVLKGHRTLVCTSDRAYVNTTGNPGMATGGMGDVLTGLIAALAGQGLSAFDAARLGVYCHGLAGDLCASRIGPVGYLARDVAEALPVALARAMNPRMGFK